MRKQLPLAAQQRFCQTTASLLQAGFTVKETLGFAAANWPQYREFWQQLQHELSLGEAFGQALKLTGFHQVIVTHVQLAATHGQLTAALLAAANFLTLRRQQQSRLQQLLVYPAVLLGLLLLLQGVIVFGVLPAFSQDYQVNWLLLLPAALPVVLAACAFLLWRLPPLVRFSLWQHLPVAKTVSLTFYQQQFATGAAQFLAAGQSLSGYAEALQDLAPGVLQHLGQQLTADFAAGVDLDTALQNPLVALPLRELLKLGQNQPLVAAGMRLVADDLFAQLKNRSENLLAVVQPLLFLVIGLQIVLVYVQILTPLYGGTGGFL